MSDLLLLGRPDCHLCEEFLEDLRTEFPQLAARVTEANVDDRPEWRTVYGSRIPVLLNPQGQLLVEGRFDSEKLRSALRAIPL